MHQKFYTILAITAIITSYSSYSAALPEDPNWDSVSPQIKRICQKLNNIVIPKDDLLQNCDANVYYYGINQPVDYTKARQCGYATDNYPVLTMIYANGKGVPVNLDLAIHFACLAGFAPAEIEARVGHLLALKNQKSSNNHFDFCDDVTSGYMMGVCADLKEKLSAVSRKEKLSSLTDSWTAVEKLAFEKLHHQASLYFQFHSANEIDLSGTARDELEIDERASLNEDFLKDLKNLAQGHLPHYTAAQAAKVDQRLNSVYRQIVNDPNFSVGTVDSEKVKQTQRLWLKYRDAWVKFGKVTYPQVNEDSWKTWLAEKRIETLNDLIPPGQ